MLRTFLYRPEMLLFLCMMVLAPVIQAADSISLRVPPITQPATDQRIPGKIVWRDLLTTDADAAQQFYSQVFGWQFLTFGDNGNRYVVIFRDGKPIGGIVPLLDEQGSGNVNQWIGYISVADVAETERFVADNGGEILLGPTRFEQQGELAVFTDPEGAAFGVMSSSSGDPEDTQSKPGDWSWADILVNDPGRQLAFYQGIADYTVEEDTRDPKFPEYNLLTEQVARAGIVPIPETTALPELLPTWLSYVSVANTRDTVAKVMANNGKVVLKPNTQVYQGRLAIVIDPGGAAVGIVQADR